VFETRLTRTHIDRYGAAGHWADRVLRDHVDRWTAETPDRVAVIDRQRTLRYAELAGAADRVAWALIRLGIGRGDVVSAQLPNWSEFVVLLLATERIGAALNPITTILRERELEQILRLGRSRVLVTPSRFRAVDHLEMALALRSAVPTIEHVIVVRGPARSGATAWEELEATDLPPEASPTLALLRPSANDVTEIAFTSGTTGTPKGVMHTHNTALCAVGSTMRRQRVGARDVVLVSLPVGHQAGYFWGPRLALQSGATLVMQDVWDAADAAALVERHRVTFTMGATTHLIDLLDRPLRVGDLRSLRVYMCGGANIPPSVAERALRELPGRFCPVFGMTEHGHSTGTDEKTQPEKLISTAGSFQPEMEPRIADEAGRALPPGREGRLLLRGPFNFVGYVQGREFTAPYFDADDFFDTGDLAVIDAEGYLRITGRTKDLVVRGGEKVPVKEIEDLLASHPAVRDVAIVGVPDDRLGERAVACVRLSDRATLTLDDVRRFMEERRVTRQFWPEELVLYEGDLPRTASGKVQKFRLREQLASQRRPVRP
jgi:cyclohexanecarboxylate-CoA ligase